MYSPSVTKKKSTHKGCFSFWLRRRDLNHTTFGLSLRAGYRRVVARLGRRLPPRAPRLGQLIRKKHPTGVFLYAAFNSPLWLIVKTWKSHR